MYYLYLFINFFLQKKKKKKKQKKWHETYSERVRVKILVILDRLIDRTVLNQSDPNFALILKWLEYLEESLHPIKKYILLNIFNFCLFNFILYYLVFKIKVFNILNIYIYIY